MDTSLLMLIPGLALVLHAASERVPGQFVGHWATEPAACVAWPAESAMRITPDALLLYASGGPVESVVVHGQEHITISAAFHDDDGSIRKRSMVLRLSEAGTRLQREDSDALYFRCASLADWH